MSRGRPPLGPKLVEGLQGSDAAKERLRIVLQTIAGELSVSEACRQLNISEARFHELRAEALQAAAAQLEPKPAGRPPQRTDEQASETAALKDQIQELKIELRATQIREELALLMPGVLQPKKQTPPEERRKRIERLEEDSKKKEPASPEIGRLARRHELHTEKLKRIWEALNMKPTRPRRGEKAQAKKRDMERSARIDALAFAHWIEKLGFSQRDAAERLKLKPGTLAEWQRRWNQDKLAPEPVGRPTRDSDWDTRQLMIAFFHLAGPGVGLPTLRGFFPDASKGELEHMLARYRAVHLRRNKVALSVLRWHKSGTVWAIDFHQPQRPVDGLYRNVFLVRDLASGRLLMTLPVPDRQLHHVTAALEALFDHFGAPLVLKSDCEFDTSRFNVCDEDGNQARQALGRLLDRHRVFHLLSPPYTPEYNAAIEASIGSFQTRAHHEAARHGHVNEWNCDDVEAARLQANELARPWGHNAATPDIAWSERSAIDPQDRAAFAASVQQFENEERQLRQQQLLEAMPLGPKEQKACRRVAISRALVAHGLLSFRRRRVTLPIKRVVWSNVM